MSIPPFGSLAGEVLRAGVVAVAVLAVLAFAEIWRSRWSPEVETTRKAVHLSIGIIGMALPWLLSSVITLLVLIVPVLILFVIARRRGWLRSVLDVERSSLGDLLFPISVLILFVIGRGDRVFYLIAMFSLVACDTLAAVLGKAYGRHSYVVEGDSKSFEGSAVFLLTAFLGVHLPLLLLTDIGRAESVIISLQLALLVTSFEALSGGGWDNLFVPLGTFYLLHKLTTKSVDDITIQLFAQLLLLSVSLLVAKVTRVLTFSGALAVHLVLYAAFSLGEPGWVIATMLALIAFVSLENLTSRVTGAARGGYQVRTIFYLAAVAVVLIFADNTRGIIWGDGSHLVDAHPFRVPFVGALAASLSAAAYMQFAAFDGLQSSRLKRGVAGVLFGLLVVAPLGFAYTGDFRLEAFAIVAAMSVASVLLVRLGRLVLKWPRDTERDLRLVAFSVLIASVSVFPLHMWWLNGPGLQTP